MALGENPGEARGGQYCCCRIVCQCRTSVLLTELLCAASLLLDDAQAPEWGRSNSPGWLLSFFGGVISGLVAGGCLLEEVGSGTGAWGAGACGGQRQAPGPLGCGQRGSEP